MSDFRKISPTRRNNPPQVKRYQEYKSFLREDFHQRCGYCGDHDFFKENFYEIDHFEPKDLRSGKEKDYSNLVYSCRLCNNSKRAKWPTQEISKPNDGIQGWIDPCASGYKDQFTRLSDGSIQPVTNLGRWMWSALTLGNPRHRIIWMLEDIRTQLINALEIDTFDKDELSGIKELAKKYFEYENSLRGTPNFQ